MSKNSAKLKNVLEKLYDRYSHPAFIKPDPLQFVYCYSNPKDMEVAAFLAAVLAYGKVLQIQNSLTRLFAPMGDSPFEFVKNFDKHKKQKLHNFKHRFTTGDCLSDLIQLLCKVLNRYGSIQEFFIQGYDSDDENIIPALNRFCDSLLTMYTKNHNGRLPRGLKYLLPKPSAGSASKRLNLFLRWMVRDDDIDTGLWKSIDKAKLIVPLDVHMARLCRILKLYDQKTPSVTAALKITKGFAQIQPADPVKYDFALSRIGIRDNCTGRYRCSCSICELYSFCFRS
ncbi:MAG: TIGR02757 family protein [Planctomycetota bacterium]|nr:MAG: TIGR02757 family protein [Planctomycetota bacterium]